MPIGVPPISLQLPSPDSLSPLQLSTYHIAPSDSFARSAALQVDVGGRTPGTGGTVTTAQVVMDDAALKNMLGDARVTLSSSDPSCVSVVADLSVSSSSHFSAGEVRSQLASSAAAAAACGQAPGLGAGRAPITYSATRPDT